MKFRNLLKNFSTFFAVVATMCIAVGYTHAQTGAPNQQKLLNGLKVLMWPDARADGVSVRVRIHSGSAFDPQGKEGAMQLLADNIFPNEAAREFFNEDLGGSLEIITTYDYIEVKASARPENFLTMLETVATAVSTPQIDKETTAKIRSALALKLEEIGSDPVHIADKAVAHQLFGTFPYGRPQMGSAESVKKIDFADLIDARQKFFTADNATIAVTGNFDRALGFRAIRRYFGNWLKSDKKIPPTFKQPDAPPTEILIVRSPQANVTVLRFAFRGTARSDIDFAASEVFAAVIHSRLESRVPEAHAAVVFVKNHAHVLPGSIVMGLSAGSNEVGQGPGKVGPSELIGKVLSDPITESEFRDAKSAVISQWSKQDVPSLWLDADTFKIAKPEADTKALGTVTLADVRNFGERVRRLPLASVLVTSPAKSE